MAKKEKKELKKLTREVDVDVNKKQHSFARKEKEFDCLYAYNAMLEEMWD